MDDLYDLSMEMEILREMYAAQLAKFCTLFEEKGIDYEKDTDNKWVKLLRETQTKYHKFQVDTVTSMYNKRIFINCFGEIEIDMYAEITGLSEKAIRKILKQLFENRCNTFYKECKYKNPNALLTCL